VPTHLKDRDKVRCFSSWSSFFFYSIFSFLLFYILYRFFSYVSFSFIFYFIFFIINMDRAYCDGFYDDNEGWQLAVFTNSNRRDNGHPMLESAFLHNMKLLNDIWGLTLVNHKNKEQLTFSTAGQSWSCCTYLGSYGLDRRSLPFLTLWGHSWMDRSGVFIYNKGLSLLFFNKIFFLFVT
jgi:hypothetical protein